jgi:hypothetical protein
MLQICLAIFRSQSRDFPSPVAQERGLSIATHDRCDLLDELDNLGARQPCTELEKAGAVDDCKVEALFRTTYVHADPAHVQKDARDPPGPHRQVLWPLRRCDPRARSILALRLHLLDLVLSASVGN